MACHTAPLLEKVKKQGITQPQHYPIPKFYIF